MRARLFPYDLRFKRPSGTSRGILTHKRTWFLRLRAGGLTGWGECGLLPGLSPDDRAGYPERLQKLCGELEGIAQSDHATQAALLQELIRWPSIRFGLEVALRDLHTGGRRLLYPSVFSRGESPQAINGLIWMGKPDFMRRQTEDLLESGYRVLKMKIGVVGLEDELSMLKDLRRRHSASQLELRVDANGAFRPDEARSVLDRLAQLEVHSIEQPIAPGQHDAMARLIVESPISVALDEELIGVHAAAEREALLQSLRPHYLILKPSLLGGFAACEDWIRRASTVSGPDAKPIGWWVTSMLESNIGLNAIAQWNFQLGNPVPCGLGTGSLYTNNLDSPLESGGGWLRFHPERSWDLSALEGTSEEGPDDVSADRPENSGRSPGNSPGKPSHKSPGESPSQSPSQSSGKPTSQS